MRLILDCPPEHVDRGLQAYRLLVADPAWTTTLAGARVGPAWFAVRRTKTGFSVRYNGPVNEDDA